MLNGILFYCLVVIWNILYFKFQIASMRKLQEQNEAYHANRAKMAETMALALEEKDQVT